jgi:hypothetical protein
LANGIERNRWYRLKISVAPAVISSSMNGELQPASVVPLRFRFEQSASLELGHFFWTLEYFTIDGDDVLFRAHFSAKCITDLKSYNMISGTAISYAYYDGLTVPFSLRFVDALASSGGSLVVLPLFDVVSKNPEPSRYLKALLKLIARILVKNEQLFIEQRFFRSLGSLLAKIDVRYLTLDCISLLYEIYRRLSDPPTRGEMLQYVFSNFELWNNMDIEQQNFICSAIFPGLLELDSDTFVHTISFGNLLIEFTAKFADSGDLAQRCWKFLFVLSSIRMDRRDGELLIASAIRVRREETCCRSLYLIVNLISDRSPEVLCLLREIRIFPPLMVLFTSTSVVRLTAVSVLAYTQSSLRTEHFGTEMINSIRLWTIENTTVRSRNQILSVMTQSVDLDDFSFLAQEFCCDVVKPIILPQFLPLLCLVLQIASPEECAQAAAYVRDSVAEFPNCRRCFDGSPHWVFWLLFLSLCHGRRQEWLSAIRLIAGSSHAVVRNISLIRIFSTVMAFSPTEMVLEILIAALRSRPTVELSQFVTRKNTI